MLQTNHLPLVGRSGYQPRVSPDFVVRFLTSFMLIRTLYFFVFCSHDQIVIPIRIRDMTSQKMKYTDGKVPPFEAIFMKAIIPVTTTMMVNVSGIRSDSFILRSFLLINLIETVIPRRANYTALSLQR
jgi:hypothetical protein